MRFRCSELPEYIFDREFDAPREMVWRAWTDPDLLRALVCGTISWNTILLRSELLPHFISLSSTRSHPGFKSNLWMIVFHEMVPHTNARSRASLFFRL